MKKYAVTHLEGGSHVVIQEDVFTFLGRQPTRFPCPVPPKSSPLDPHPRAQIPNFYVPSWIDRKLPCLAFIPATNPFKCAFLRCLDYSYTSFPIEKVREGFALHESLRDDWDSLEKNMRVFLRACLRVNQLPFPQGLTFWSYPLQYGYRKAYTTAEAARRVAFRSRQAFLPLIGAISLVLHMLYHLENKMAQLLATPRLPEDDPSLSKYQREYHRVLNEPPPRVFE